MYITEIYIKELVNKKYVFMYHGTNVIDIPIIKKEGLMISYMGEYIHNIDPTLKPQLFFTTNKNYANWYADMKTKKEKISHYLFRRSHIIMLAKLDTRFIKQLLSGKKDEWMYEMDVPPQDIFLPDNPLYNKIEQMEDYLIH